MTTKLGFSNKCLAENNGAPFFDISLFYEKYFLDGTIAASSLAPFLILVQKTLDFYSS